MPSISLEYSRKDTLLKNFFSSPSDVKISNIITLAIEYYAITNHYLHIGTVTTTEYDTAKIRKSIYIPDDSLAYKFLTDKHATGISFKKIITKIIINGLDISDRNAVITRDEYLITWQKLEKMRGESEPILSTARSKIGEESTITSPAPDTAVSTLGNTASSKKDQPLHSPKGSKGNFNFAEAFSRGLDNLSIDD